MAGNRPVSSLVLAELYDSGDASFLDVLLQQPGDLFFTPFLGLLEKWKKDRRPWARRAKLEYVLGDRLTRENRVVFKRLFKQAWADRDHELMAAFMVAVDRFIRRGRSRRHRFNRGSYEIHEVLRLPPASPNQAFATATRHYLRRRAWRYFRRLGFSDAAAYPSAVAAALVRYTDDDVRAGENLLDNWGLMHACFGKSPVMTFNARHTNLSAAGRLADLEAAPMFERHSARAESFPLLLDVLLRAACRPMRVWAIQLLRRLHQAELPKIDAATLLKLIDHADPDVAGFAAELLGNAQTVGAFPMTTWMGLLGTRNPAVVASMCETFRKHVSFDRVSLAQAVELTTRAAVPVATLGLEILGGKAIRSDADHRELANLAAARADAVGESIAAFALARLNVPRVYRVDDVVGFFDSPLPSMREGAFAALAPQSPVDEDPAFWSRLFESPYDDVRTALVNRLRSRGTLPGASADALASLWQNVLLNIHRGGRAKLTALRQISDYVARDPGSTPRLLPVLAVALRSVRPPETRHGLAAIVSAVEREPSLRSDVERHFPELRFDVALAGAGR